jgi:hypothetical protein
MMDNYFAKISKMILLRLVLAGLQNLNQLTDLTLAIVGGCSVLMQKTLAPAAG